MNQKYVDNILRSHVISYAKDIGGSFFLIHDIARHQTVPEMEIIQLKKWPTCSSGLNRNEHV